MRHCSAVLDGWLKAGTVEAGKSDISQRARCTELQRHLGLPRWKGRMLEDLPDARMKFGLEFGCKLAASP